MGISYKWMSMCKGSEVGKEHIRHEPRHWQETNLEAVPDCCSSHLKGLCLHYCLHPQSISNIAAIVILLKFKTMPLLCSKSPEAFVFHTEEMPKSSQRLTKPYMIWPHVTSMTTPPTILCPHSPTPATLASSMLLAHPRQAPKSRFCSGCSLRLQCSSPNKQVADSLTTFKSLLRSHFFYEA